MNKLNVGDYVRTREYIRKIRKIEQEYIYCDIGVLVESEIIKSSPNIINLIEVGDYVNGIYIEGNNGKYLETLEDDYDNSRLEHIEFIKIYPNEIKSIVTHEQFENISYKVGE